MGVDPPFTPKSSFPGGQQACEPVKVKYFGGAEIEQSACAMGKRGSPLANAISIVMLRKDHDASPP